MAADLLATLFRLTAFISLLCCIQPSAAQNSSTDSGHGFDIDGCRHYPMELANRTGTVEFNVNHDGLQSNMSLYLTHDLHDSRPDTSPISEHATLTWLSVPENVEARGCIYSIVAQNSTRESLDQFGCDGILTPSCISDLRGLVGFDSDGECALVNNTLVQESCGAGNSVWFTSTPVDFTGAPCSLETPPSDTEVPRQGYRSLPISLAGLPGDQPADDFELYDLRAQQSYPYVVAVRIERDILSETAAEVVCVSPMATIGESREPEAPLPGSGAGEMKTSFASVLAIAGLVVCLVA